jgi:chemotaxis protein CheX
MSSIKVNEMLDAKLVNAFVKATIDVFKHISIANVSLVKVVGEENFVPQGDVSALVNLNNSDGEGAIILYFPFDLARTLACAMMGVAEVDEKGMMDLTGEFVNIITGNAKEVMLFRESSTPYNLSLPTVVMGSGHQIHTPYQNCPSLILQFRAEQQEFLLQIQYQTLADLMESM